MPTIQLILPRPHLAQQAIKREARRFNVLSCGRRFGKTTLGIDVLAPPALESYPVAFFSPTYKMLSDVWRDMRRALAPVTARVSSQEHRLELITGGVVDMWSLDNPDAARGRKYKRIFVDEAAMIGALQEAWTAVIRPTLTDYTGEAWFGSTPKGLNYFHTIWRRGQKVAGQVDEYPEWASWQLPTTANPLISAAEVDAARRELPERTFSQEYLAQFLQDGAFFQNIEALATAAPQAAAAPGKTYVIGVDWARASGGDFTVFAVVDVQAQALVHLTRFAGKPYESQLALLRDLWTAFGGGALVVEYNSMGGPLVERLQAEGLPVLGFVTSAASKHQIISDLELAFDRRAITIVRDAVLVNELQTYEKLERTGQYPKYSAPDGMHDDTVMALALAWHGARNTVTTVPNTLFD
jgi:hypothetical protein